MSHTRSFIDPLDVAGHLKLEPEVKRATLLSWASDRAAVKGQPAPLARRAPVTRCRSTM
ncbi:hypothetical protein Sj15T_40910 (plasmid) [Sphingobium sp. TA15]|uniref:Uncharacterized protein n=1 Tax=Sphingobium fuliginis (strain ATCC 27551) TaxID=336203 RepID=A0ABQ1F598_SPHSA|nr:MULTISPECIES: hypothetical protein [Sphingomonadaceae]BDD69070.1 hypothetical protein Sj15T_40910 [Sphingobium sp. TA15]GFZ99779.1 hypothetical protein GCM10019071_32860 [Sphingobium fuliginis]CAD7341210.1 hypothetical protein SPHS6_03442 [Sphingobium sp. S6]CAD7341219.1 hypothetical protein SPHS8_03418 [Sphingobium sp. S8]